MSESVRVMFLDDQQSRADRLRARKPWLVHHAETAREAIRKLNMNADYDLIMLDHDLEEEHYAADGAQVGTGMEVARWLAENANPFTAARIIVHSLNEPAAKRMVATMRAAGLQASHIPFAWEKI